MFCKLVKKKKKNNNAVFLQLRGGRDQTITLLGKSFSKLGMHPFFCDLFFLSVVTQLGQCGRADPGCSVPTVGKGDVAH